MTAYISQSSSGLSFPLDWTRRDESQLSALSSHEDVGIAKPPPGLPNVVEGPLVWNGTSTNRSWPHILELDQNRVNEIEDGLFSFLCKSYLKIMSYLSNGTSFYNSKRS